MVEGRYILYGVVPDDHDEANSDLTGDLASQKAVGNTIPLYGTDDQEEAMKVYRAGGFERNGRWLAVTWAQDTHTGGTVGAKPEV